jgi:hypothetical protein
LGPSTVLKAARWVVLKDVKWILSRPVGLSSLARHALFDYSARSWHFGGASRPFAE